MPQSDWQEVTFKTSEPDRRNSPTAYDPRCVVNTNGILVLDKQRLQRIDVVDEQPGGEESLLVIGGAHLTNSAAGLVTVYKKYYESIVILNDDSYTIIGKERKISRRDPYGLWVIE